MALFNLSWFWHLGDRKLVCLFVCSINLDPPLTLSQLPMQMKLSDYKWQMEEVRYVRAHCKTKMLLYSLLQLVLWVQWRWGRLRTWREGSIWMCSLLTSTRSWWPCTGAVCADRLSFYMKASKPSCAFIRSEVKGSFLLYIFLSLYFHLIFFLSFYFLHPFLSIIFCPFLSLSWNYRSQITVFYTFVSMHCSLRAISVTVLGWPQTKYICL